MIAAQYKKITMIILASQIISYIEKSVHMEVLWFLRFFKFFLILLCNYSNPTLFRGFGLQRLERWCVQENKMLISLSEIISLCDHEDWSSYNKSQKELEKFFSLPIQHRNLFFSISCIKVHLAPTLIFTVTEAHYK